MKYLKTLLILLTLGSITAFMMVKDKEGLDKKKLKTLKHSDWRQVDDSLFMFETEVSNYHYKWFFKYLEEQGKADLIEKYKPDSTRWREISEFSETKVKAYHNSLNYSSYPVVNITHESAIAFCDYLNEIYNGPWQSLNFFKKVKVRLPTKQEWMDAAGGPQKRRLYTWEGSGLLTKKDGYRANFMILSQYNLKAKFNDEDIDYNYQEGWPIRGKNFSAIGFATTPVRSYWSNDYGLYNMCGNVAEMLDEPGTTKGGSWGTTAYYMCIYNEDDPYAGWTEPSPFIGFRPVMEIIEE